MPLEFDGVNGIVKNTTSDGDVTIKGNDGGSEISAVTFDMSAEGGATFNNWLEIPDYIYHTADSNTYFGFNANDNFELFAGGTDRLSIVGSETVFNDGSADKDFRVESNGNTHALFVDAGNDHVNIGTSSDLGGVLNVNGQTVITTADNTDTLTLTSTDADANSGPNLRLYRNSSSPADSDILGQIDFEGRNDNSQDFVATQIKVNVGDVSDGTEDAQIEFDVMTAGTLREYLRMASGSEPSVVINEDSQDIDFRVESDNKTHAFFVEGSDGGIGIGTGTIEANAQVHIEGAEEYVVIKHAGQMGIKLYGDDTNVIYSYDKSQNTLTGGITFNHANGTMIFATNGSTERMRIDNDGHVRINATTSEETAKFCVATTQVVAEIRNENASYGSSNSVQSIACKRASIDSYRLLRGVSGNGSDTLFSDNEFIFTGAGGLAIDGGSVTTGGADYAEMFEWKDGNSSSEDRRGYSVVLDGNQIIKATDSDDASKIIGVVSAMPVVIGDSDIDDKWKSKYLKDDFGNYVMEDYTVTEWTEVVEDGDDIEHSYATDRIPDDITAPSDATVISTEKDGAGNTINLQRKKLNTDWDGSKTYVRRKDRKEWDAIGLMGKLRMLKGQPTGTNWIKMRDISDTVEEWLVR